MREKTIPIVALLAVALLAARPAPAAENEISSTRALLDRMISRLGGAEAIARVRSLAVEADCHGPGGAFRTWVDSFRPGHVRFRQQIDGQTQEIWSTPDGTWRRTAEGALEELPPAVASFVQGHEFHLLLFEVEDRFADHRASGTDELDGERCDRISMNDRDGHPAALCLARDGLPLRLELNPPGAAGPLEIRFADWETIDGALYFRSFELAEGADRTFTYAYTEIVPNRVSALEFVPPAPAGLQAAQEEVLAVLQDERQAHLRTDAALLGSHLAETLVAVSDGEVLLQPRADVIGFFADYFSDARYPMWEDSRPPLIRLSADGTMAWVARAVRVERVSTGEGGAATPLAFTSAFTSTYEKRGDGWKMTSVTSTFPRG
jgi:hypothetical protein